MVFSSLKFIFVFLPAFLAAYYIVPKRGRNIVLLVGSLCFYFYGSLDNPAGALLLPLSLVVNYGLGRAIGSGKRKKAWLVIGVIYNLAWLFLFKYSKITFETINALFPTASVPGFISNLVMPLGVSFYTFEIIVYLADVYRRRHEAEKSIFRLAVWLTMFPQLISGPITPYREVRGSLRERSFTLRAFDSGLSEFIIGLGLKVILANNIGNLWSDISTIGFDSISCQLAWMGAVGVSLQIYFDFYGYSLMAIGLGRMLGFELPVNFDFPYVSRSMGEFWRRWHMTLGRFFRDYVYIPLGGSRAGSLRTVVNLLVVWLLTGVWHGAGWNFLLWGAALFVLIALEKLGVTGFIVKSRVLSRVYMILAIPLSWLVFKITDLAQLGVYFTRLFPFGGLSGYFQGDWLKYGKTYGILLAVGILFSTPLPRAVYERVRRSWLGIILLLAIFWTSVYLICVGLDDPFIYFRF